MRRSFFIASFLLMLASGYGQIPADSVFINQAQMAFELANSAPDSAYALADRILQQSLPAGRVRVSAFANRAKGWALLRLGNYDSSLYYLLNSARQFRALNDTVETMYMYANLASAYSASSRFVESANYLIRADSLAKGRNDVRIDAGLQKQMGILYRQQQNYNKATPYFKESMRLYLTAADTLHFLDVITSLSINYNMMSHADSSLALLEANMPVMEKFKGPVYQQAMLKERFGDTYFALRNYGKALATYKQAYELFAADNNHADQGYEAMNVGRAYMELKDYRNAEQFLLMAYQLNDSLHMTSYAHDAAEVLSHLYQSTRDWQNAFTWLQKKGVLKDSLRLTEQNEQIAELQAKYETAKKDNEISLLKKDRQLNLLTLQKQKTFRYGAIIILIFLALLGGFLVNHYRTMQKARRQIEMEKLRNDIARDLHDDMGSVLSSINIMSKVALEGPEEKERIRSSLAKIHENSTYMLEGMSDIVWTINPENDSFGQILYRMKEFTADVLEPQNIRYEFNISEDLKTVPLSLRKRRDLFLLFKEAINNAAKYSRCANVLIDIVQQDEGIRLSVKDDGVGFDASNSFSGNGLGNMRQRAERMGAAFTISSQPGTGTHVSVSIISHE